MFEEEMFVALGSRKAESPFPEQKVYKMHKECWWQNLFAQQAPARLVANEKTKKALRKKCFEWSLYLFLR